MLCSSYGLFRKSDKINEVLSFSAVREFIDEQMAHREAVVEQKKVAREKQSVIPATRTTVLRRKVPEPEQGALWVMPQFRHAEPATQSFRSPSARSRAWQHHVGDGAARVGLHQHGVYATEIAP